MRIAVTGAGGFVGQAVVSRAIKRGHEVRALIRGRTVDVGSQIEVRAVGDLEACDNLEALFENCDAVINLAARVHVTRETSTDPAGAYRRLNRDLALRLADAAATARARRFVQLSSVAAIASLLPAGKVADDDTLCTPQNLYGESKRAADEALIARANDDVSIACLRPPTVFGPGVTAFFAQLMHAARLGIPLPIGGFDNLRSFIYVDNLADAAIVTAEQQFAGIYVVTDSPPKSTADLYRALLAAYGRPTWLPKLPSRLVRAVSGVVLGERVESLLGCSAFDGQRFAVVAGWTPPVSFEEAIMRTVNVAR